MPLYQRLSKAVRPFGSMAEELILLELRFRGPADMEDNVVADDMGDVKDCQRR